MKPELTIYELPGAEYIWPSVYSWKMDDKNQTAASRIKVQTAL